MKDKKAGSNGEESEEEKSKAAEIKENKRRPGKRKGRGFHLKGKRSKVEQNSCSATNSENDLSENDESSENCDNRKKTEGEVLENNDTEKTLDENSDKPSENRNLEVEECKNVNTVSKYFFFLESKLINESN